MTACSPVRFTFLFFLTFLLMTPCSYITDEFSSFSEYGGDLSTFEILFRLPGGGVQGATPLATKAVPDLSDPTNLPPDMPLTFIFDVSSVFFAAITDAIVLSASDDAAAWSIVGMISSAIKGR